MRPLRATWIRFRNLFRTRQLNRDLDAELAAHLELHIADNLRTGMSAAEARRQALVKLGGLEQTKDRYRHAEGFPLLESLLQDLRFAGRTLRKNPGFTAVAILTLALGIGANTAIFSVVDAVLLRSLPFPRSSELVDISGRSTSFDIAFLNLSMPDVADLRTNASSFASLAVYQDSPKELTSGGVPDRIESSQVSEDFFPTLAVPPLLGRTFTVADMQPSVRSAVLNYSMWRGRFGGDAGIVGRSITLDDLPYTIIGVMPDLQAIGFASDSSVWTAFIPSNEDRTARDGFTVAVVARLKRGVTSAMAQHELDLLSARLSAAYPEAHPNWSLHVTPLKTFLLGDTRTPLTVLFCAVGFVLLIACANVSSLFLSRNWSRQREFAIRLAIGAPRSAILRQLAVESFLVALAAGLCALVCAWGSLHGLRSILPPEMPRLQNLRLD
ncbi:MAG TPA: ABC transporter permease, partial [Candidatus Acidoferrum sp.]|nr:ABC transporter permease [Candidatus Acidoferrum sp.]